MKLWRLRSGSLALPVGIRKKFLAAKGTATRETCGESAIAAVQPRLGICDLDGNAGLAQRDVLHFPGGMDFTFGIGVGGIAIAKFDGIGGVEIARLHAFTFDPDIFDARNFCGHVFNALDGFLLVGVGGGGIPFEFDDMENGFRLAEAVLPGDVAASKERCRQE